ncbi:MAG: hypothetical protein HOE53_04545 [Candidatus Magasanikbacteria bacterium]|jgi:tRNA A37 threonylcarbamoyladenosine modification protein TsaB|nr:hypothetical protein [Candidatus Magasanikbacteria bacterium]
MIITIDVAERSAIQVKVVDAAGKRISDAVSDASRHLLRDIISLLKSSSVKKDDIDGIIVFGSKGSFTDTRIAITIANTWHVATGTKVLAAEIADWEHDSEAVLKSLKEHNGFIRAEYSGEPHIG